MTRAVVLLALAGALAACVPEGSPLMRPGQDCLACHVGENRPWTVAGTIYAAPDADENAGLEGAEVLVTDANGRELTMRTNPAGNFFTREALAAPYRVEVQYGETRMAMSHPPASGSCNSCHVPGSTAGAPGRVFVPTERLVGTAPQ